MKKRIFPVIFLVFFPMLAHAQFSGPSTTKQECSRRCQGMNLVENVKMAQYAKKLEQIRAQKKNETDVEKLKALSRQEQEVNEQSQDQHEKICREICKGNPDE